MNIEQALSSEMIRIVRMIVKNDFVSLEAQEVSKETVQNELASYGGKISDTSDDNYLSSFDYLELSGSNKFMCYMDL